MSTDDKLEYLFIACSLVAITAFFAAMLIS